MSQANEVAEANRLERSFRWLEAATKYQQVLISLRISDEIIDISKIHERIGNCYYYAAYQSEDESEFIKLVNAAQKALEKAEITCPDVSNAKILSCRGLYNARRIYLQSLVASSDELKRELLDKALNQSREVLQAWSDRKGEIEYLDAVANLLLYLETRGEIARDYIESTHFIEEAQALVDSVVKISLKDDEKAQNYWIRFHLSKIILDKPIAIYNSIEKQKNGLVKSLENSERAYNGSNKLKDAQLIGSAAGVLGFLTFEIKGNLETSIKYANSQLAYAKTTKDKLQLAQAYELLSYLTSWKTNTLDEDPKIQVSENLKALKLAEDSLSLYKLVNRPATISYLSHIGSFNHLVRTEERIEEKKRILMEGIAAAKRDLDEARKSGSLLGIIFILNEYIHLLFRSISLSDNEKKKIGFIEEAESAVTELITLANKAQPFRYWNLSVFKFQFVRLKMERARIESISERKKEILLAALREGEDCVKLSKLHLETHPSKILFLDYAVGLRRMGELLINIYTVTNESTYIERSVEAYRETLDIYKKYEQLNRVAEIQWQMASLYGKIGEYLSASKEFDLAAKYYRDSTQKIPSLADFYMDYARYMEAWSQISQAKHYNVQNQYSKVKMHYENAARLHEQTRRWAYLKQNYSSWAKLAEAEDLSLKEKAIEAKKGFKELSQMFEGSRKIIEAHMNSIDIFDEKLMAEKIIKASSNRIQYCLGRIALEEARILDNDGDEAASSSKYNEAANTFQTIYDAMETESERSELLPIIKLCRAWGLMTHAEAESSPIFYLDAAQIFEAARDCSLTPKTKTMAQGHNYFCKALYESLSFENTRELDSYKATSQFLMLASNSYLKAGYDRAFEYTKAVQRLLDAYLYINNANSETNPENKAKFFTLAEKVLEESIKSYSKANYPKKRREVNKLLKSVKKEQQLALSLAQVFRGPLISASTASFNLPLPTHEYPVGLSDFEHANIQATVDIQSLNVNTNNPFDLIITLSNTGKASASLIRIENIVKGKLVGVAVSGIYNFKGEYVDLKGKRLSPSSTEDITITLNPLSKGEYRIKPRILYLNDTNENVTCDLQTIELRVTDLGLSDWLKGTRQQEKTRSKK